VSQSLPDPLVPAEVDLQDFPFMPLHVARLRDSNLAAEEEPETCWYAVLLWAASWHQIPAGSLPDNDTVLMRLVGLGRDKRTWKKHREGALRGFVLCSDGRLYHPVVAETALESWNSKLRQRHAAFCAAVRQHNKRNPDNCVQSPSFDEWDALGRPSKVADHVTEMSRVTEPEITRDNGSKRREETVKGQGYNIEEPKGSSCAQGAPKPDPKPKPKMTRLPADWQPAPFGIGTECRSIVDGWPPGELARQIERFTAHHTAKGSRFENWHAAWKTWVLNSREFGHGRQANGAGRTSDGRGGSTRDAAQLALDRLHSG